MFKSFAIFSNLNLSNQIASLTKRSLQYSFSSKRKGLQQNIKQKSQRSIKKTQGQPQYNANFLQLSNMKILNMQFFPISLLLSPCLFYIGQYQNAYFLLGPQMAEKYASAALWMNMDFKQQTLNHNNPKLDKSKLTLFLITTAFLHCLPSYYSIITPIGMCLLSIAGPFKFLSTTKQRLTEVEISRLQTMTKIKMTYFFVFVFLGLLKALHYEQVYGIQKKFEEFNKENRGELLK